jgi:membrane associated rhomboid family serine protease
MLPLRDDNPTRTAPVITRALIVANVLVFLAEWFARAGLREWYSAYALVPGRVTLAVHGGVPFAPAAFTLVTSMFMHAGWVHLIGNMWFLWIFGDNIEDRLGHFRFLAFYLACGIVAGALHVASRPDSALPTVGASGAIAGVLGAYAAAFPRARVITLVPLFPFFPVVTLPALVVLGFWFVMQFASGALSLLAGATGGVAWWAHVGGFAFGLLAMRAVAPRRTLFTPARMV